MDSNKCNSIKKIRLTSKSQFNKNVKQQLETLDVIRKNNTTLSISLPTQFTTTAASTLYQPNFIDVPNDFCVVKNNVSNISDVSLEDFSENVSSSTFVSSSKICSSSNNFVNDNVFGKSKIPTPDQLREWAIRNKISHVALSELLSILKEIPGLDNIPKDPRTFLKTPRTTILRDINPGKYYHFGLENGLTNILKKVNVSNIPDTINVAINIDGLPLSSSSQSQVYPILCLITNVDILLPLNIFCIGIYHGYDKPSDFNELLEDFVNEAVNLTLNGVYIGDKYFSFKISMLLFDAVAKASVLRIKGHSGYSSCSKCMQEGEYLDHVVFPDMTFTKRTDTDFINQTDPEHHTGRTILQRIPNLGLVSDVPLDYMHLICLGVVKKLLVNIWCFGKPPHKLQSRSVNIISDSLLNLIKYIPHEFARKPRPIKEAKRYKATELRQFLLYTGVIVLENHLDKNKYEHFLTLHVAVRILLSDSLMKTMTDYAEELLKHFVLSSKLIYGPQILSHNFHNLLHITDDARKYGNLNLFSNFSSENYLQKIKKLLRTHNNVLSQIVRRLSEESTVHTLPEHKIKKGGFKFQKEHSDGILIDGTTDPQFKEVIFSNFKLSINLQNACCKLNCDSIIEISNFAFCPKLDQVVVIGRKYNNINNLYTKPLNSSLIGIHLVDGLSECFSYWPLPNILYKLIRLPHTKGFVVMPLLHTEE